MTATTVEPTPTPTPEPTPTATVEPTPEPTATTDPAATVVVIDPDQYADLITGGYAFAVIGCVALVLLTVIAVRLLSR